MNRHQLHLPGLLMCMAIAGPVQAQFVDTFDMIDPAWVTNRYEPAGFETVAFDGDARLRLTIDKTGSVLNRPPASSDAFYGVQGRERPGGITGPWTLSAEVYVASAFNTTSGQLVSSELWAHTGTTPAGGAYLTLGFTNASPTNAYDPAASDRVFRFQAWNATGNQWIDLGVPVGFQFDAWHVLSGTATGPSFEYRIDDVLVYTYTTATGGTNDLLSVMIQGYQFNEAGSYAVHWDNVTASAIPEPAVAALAVAVGALALALARRRRRTIAAGAGQP